MSGLSESGHGGVGGGTGSPSGDGSDSRAGPHMLGFYLVFWQACWWRQFGAESLAQQQAQGWREAQPGEATLSSRCGLQTSSERPDGGALGLSVPPHGAEANKGQACVPANLVC